MICRFLGLASCSTVCVACWLLGLFACFCVCVCSWQAAFGKCHCFCRPFAAHADLHSKQFALNGPSLPLKRGQKFGFRAAQGRVWSIWDRSSWRQDELRTSFSCSAPICAPWVFCAPIVSGGNCHLPCTSHATFRARRLLAKACFHVFRGNFRVRDRLRLLRIPFKDRMT